MIGKLKGMVDSFGDDWVLIDCGGVCYEVFCSGRTLQALPRVGEAAVLFIETIVREDFIRLYGFSSDAEKELVHPALDRPGRGRAGGAVHSLHHVARRTLECGGAAGQGHDRPANGVGPKLALRVVTELKGKVPAIGAIDAGTLGLQAALGEGVAAGNVADAVSALTNLGYSSAQASSAVARVVVREGEDTPTEKAHSAGIARVEPVALFHWTFLTI